MGKTVASYVYASNEPKSVLARDLGDWPAEAEAADKNPLLLRKSAQGLDIMGK